MAKVMVATIGRVQIDFRYGELLQEGREEVDELVNETLLYSRALCPDSLCLHGLPLQVDLSQTQTNLPQATPISACSLPKLPQCQNLYRGYALRF